MLFDPNRRENVSPEMKMTIARILQRAVLDEILAGKAWSLSDLVFHGGTSIHLVWNSPRFSEDLDFMVSVEKAVEIDRVMSRAVAGIERQLALSMPGTEIRLKAPKDGEVALRKVRAYDVIWTHPNKFGSVRVKTEFFPVELSHVEAYRKEARWQREGLGVTSTPDFPMPIIQAAIPAAALESLYGDKLIALAKRPYMKARDYFDLWWLHTQLGVRIPDDGLHDVLRRTADCYAYSDNDLLAGVERLLQRPENDPRIIADNLRAFVSPEFHAQLERGNAFAAMHAHVMREAERMREVLEAVAEPVISP